MTVASVCARACMPGTCVPGACVCVCATFGALYSQTALGLYLTTTLHIVLTQLIAVHNLTHILVV